MISFSARSTIHGTRSELPEARRELGRQRSASLGYAASVPTRRVPSACPPPTAEWWDSSRHLAASAPESGAAGIVLRSRRPDHKPVYDAALMLQVMSLYDSLDPCGNPPPPSFVSAFDEYPAKIRIGIPRAFFFDDLHPDIADAIEKAVDIFRHLNAEVRDIKLEVPTDRTLASAEAYAYHKEFVERSPELYQPATLQRINSGANIDAHDALRAARELQASRHDIQEYSAMWICC